jgi:cysteine synthase A
MLKVVSLSNVLELIGNTPMLKLERLGSAAGANVFVKCEFLNPSGSIKDRMALRMIVHPGELGGRI